MIKQPHEMEFHERRAYELRLALFYMRDAREVTLPAGFDLKPETKAELYDIQQNVIRAAIAADDRRIAVHQPMPVRLGLGNFVPPGKRCTGDEGHSPGHVYYEVDDVTGPSRPRRCEYVEPGVAR